MKLLFLERWKLLGDPNRPLVEPGTLPLFPLLYLLPLGWIFNLTGYLPPYLRWCLIYALLGLPLCLRPSRESARGGLVLLGLMFIQAWVPLSPVADIALLLLAHQWIWMTVTAAPSALVAGLVFYAFLHCFLFLSPLGYPVIETLARWGCQVAGWLTGSDFNLGPSYLNAGGFLLFLCLSVFGWDRTGLSKARTGSFLVVALLLSGLLSVILIRKVNLGADLVWQLKFRELFGYAQLFAHLRSLAVLAFPAVVFMAWLLAYLVLHYETWRAAPAPPPPPFRGRPIRRLFHDHYRQAGIMAIALALVAASMPPTAWRRPVVSELIFVERGVVSYTKPDYERFGRAAGGMFGLFPDYARLFGCKAVVVKEVPDLLDPTQVLVLTNLDAPMPPDVFRRIWAFVEAGGKLWVLGDHTFIKNGRNHLNDLLAPCHITFQHDSAQFFPQGWFHSYQFLQGTAFAGLQDMAENRPAILVGASLELKRPALPLILGRFGYSDWGVSTDVDNRGYIGDFKYQPQERLGDLVLVAGEKYGRGRILVFGDTTSFFNNNLSRSYEILRCALSWFGESPRWLDFAAWPVRLGIIALLAALGVLLRIFPSAWGRQAILLATLFLALLGQRSTGSLPLDREYARSHLAVIDFAHEPYASKHSSMESGLHGVSINLTRYGLLPVAINRWDGEILDAARLVVLNAPRRPFTGAERLDLDRFMRRGGTVWLGCGFPHYDNCQPLLAPLQMRVRGLPLGRFFDRFAFGQRVSFVSAWPVEVDNPDASVICLYDQWPLMVLAPVGQGRLILISDSEFLHNRNIEGFENYDPANIQFLKALLDFTVGGRGS